MQNLQHKEILRVSTLTRPVKRIERQDQGNQIRMRFVAFKSWRARLWPKCLLAALLLAVLPLAPAGARSQGQAPAIQKSDFDTIEGAFHDGLGTFAEIALANELIAQAHLSQTPIDAESSRHKIREAIRRQPDTEADRG